MRNGSTGEGEAWQCVWHSCPWWGLLRQAIFALYAPKNTVLFICLGYCDVLWMKANWWVFLIFFTLFAASPSHCVGFCGWKIFVYSIFNQYVGLSIFAVFSRLFSATPPLFMFWFVFIHPTTYTFGIISVSLQGDIQNDSRGIMRELVSGQYLTGQQLFGDLGCEICQFWVSDLILNIYNELGTQAMSWYDSSKWSSCAYM